MKWHVFVYTNYCMADETEIDNTFMVTCDTSALTPMLLLHFPSQKEFVFCFNIYMLCFVFRDLRIFNLKILNQ